MQCLRAILRHLPRAVCCVPIMSGMAHAADPATVSVVANAKVPTVRVAAAGTGDVMVPACRGVVWQRFDEAAAGYVPVSTRPCTAMEPGQLVSPKGREFTIDGRVSDGDVVRAVVVVGVGCTTGQPFELADCDSVMVVEGTTTTVRGTLE